MVSVSPLLILFLSAAVLVASGQYYPAYTSSYFRSPYATRYSGGGYYGGLNYPYSSQIYNGYYNNIPGRYYNNYNQWSPSLIYQGGYSGLGGGYNGYSGFQQGYPFSGGISYNGFGYKK